MVHELRPGDTLDGKYRIDALLGQGGMGAVYRATHLGTTRPVAVKVIRPHLSHQREFLQRFRREAEAAGQLRHPNVVDVTDFGVAQADGSPVAYLVMELLDGCTLSDVLAEERRLPVGWVVDVLEQVCSALDEAHAHGIVHRDLKPDNIWLEPNRRGGFTVKVLDFGLVQLRGAAESPASHDRDVNATSPLNDSETPTIWVAADETAHTAAATQPGSVTGTPLYMSPEQIRGAAVDGRSDIYSLGVVAYRMLAGETPFTGDVGELLQQHVVATPRQLRQLNHRVPARVAELVMAALSKDPEDRPATAGGFASALRAGAEGSGTLLRQALALYSDRLPALLRVSLVGYIPLVIVLAALAPLDSGDAAQAAESPLVSIIVIGLMVFTNVVAYVAVSAATVPIVVQSIVAPLRPVSMAAAWKALRRRLMPLAVSTILVGALVFAASVLLVIPGLVVAMAHVLYAPVVMMEYAPPWTALRRARQLARRSWSTVLIITALQFALPVLVWVTAVDMSWTFRLDEQWQPRELSFGLNVSWSSALYQLLNILVAPLTATMTALLYLKLRHAGGESLRESALRIAADDIGRSRWQSRMRHRSSSDTLETRERSAPSPAH